MLFTLCVATSISHAAPGNGTVIISAGSVEEGMAILRRHLDKQTACAAARCEYQQFAPLTVGKDLQGVFFGMAACCGGSNVATHLAIWKAENGGVRLLATDVVGGKWLPIDTAFVLLVDGGVYVRLAYFPLWDEPRGLKPAEKEYYLRYQIADGAHLQARDGVFRRVGRDFVKVR
ncbi:MAG TPA: hypothetical protein VLC08_08210 [Chitinolyticbacter sp.]|nr:hypothetical protein [Chitinolyticbacter sp.]